jgi:hypothetical protein
MTYISFFKNNSSLIEPSNIEPKLKLKLGSKFRLYLKIKFHKKLFQPYVLQINLHHIVHM